VTSSGELALGAREVRPASPMQRNSAGQSRIVSSATGTPRSAGSFTSNRSALPASWYCFFRRPREHRREEFARLARRRSSVLLTDRHRHHDPVAAEVDA
jgi:hypothetical protein